MKLTDVNLEIIDGIAYLTRRLKNGKLYQKREVEAIFNKRVIEEYSNNVIYVGDKVYFSKIVEATPEQITNFELVKNAKDAVDRKQVNLKLKKLEATLSKLYAGYSDEKMEELKKLSEMV